MNKDQVEGTAKATVGKVQQSVGKAIGSAEQQAKGLGKQITGNIQKGVGDAEEAMKDNAKKNEYKKND